MKKGYSVVKQLVKSMPIPLKSIKEEKLIQYANSFLPYSVGIEFEANANNCRNLHQKGIDIPNILNVSIDLSEQRFRIPEGINGAICLYDVCSLMKQDATLNLASGIHYHIDFTDISEQKFHKLIDLHCNNPNSFILRSLKSWGYKGSYNSWIVSTGKQAVRFHRHYQTLEIRIGEMSFEYELIMKRIIHCQNIAKALKRSLI